MATPTMARSFLFTHGTAGTRYKTVGDSATANVPDRAE